jgi:predicted TIM-barrel fold metal-dependent hydrolase
LSIKPHYAEAIFSGRKRYEFRRSIFREDIRVVIVYMSSPVMEVVGDDRVMFPSDYPHERVYGEFLKDIPELLKRPELSDRAKQKILYDNAKALYGL